MPEPAPDEAAALEYFRRHGGAFSREALAEQLRQAGASQETIDRAAAAYQAEAKA